MTANKIPVSVKKSRFPISEYTLFAISLSFAVFLILHPHIAPSAVNSALSGCVYRLVPSLFPFICISGILTRADFGGFCGRLIGKPFSALTGFHPDGASAYILGVFCGFPVGGCTALSVGKSSDMSKNETLLLCVLCNNAGLGFVVCGIGIALWGSAQFGALLFILNLFSAYITVIVAKCFILGKSPLRKSFTNAPTDDNLQNISVLKVISESVADASLSILKICAFVVFFTLVTEGFGSTLQALPYCEISKTAIAVLFEISTANELTHELFLSGEMLFARMLTFFSVGFGGMSAGMQLISFMGNQVNGANYLILKLIQGCVCSVLGITIVIFFPWFL